MSEVVPTLSTSGWVNSVKEKADRLMSYFLVSQYSSSHTYNGMVSSLPYLIKIHQLDYPAMGSAIEQSLYSLFKGYFDSAEFRVTVDPTTDSESVYSININATVVSNGLKYSLGRLIETTNGTLAKVKIITD